MNESDSLMDIIREGLMFQLLTWVLIVTPKRHKVIVASGVKWIGEQMMDGLIERRQQREAKELYHD